MANQETIGRIQNMPTIVGRLREEVLPIDNVDYTLSTLLTILNEESYELSPQQNQILQASYGEFKQDREGILQALEGDNFDKLKATLATVHNISTKDIEDITIHPTSLTFALSPLAFVKVYDPHLDLIHSGYIPHDFPRGFTNYNFRIPLDDQKVRYSFRESKRSDDITAEHENLHVIYNYLHPFRLADTPSAEAYTEFAQSTSGQQDRASFEHTLFYVGYQQMYEFLHELSSHSLRGRSIVDQFIGDRADEDYTKQYNNSLTALRKGLPEGLKERFPWERMIWEANSRLTHWIKFVDKEYRELVDANVPTDQITNTLLTLNPYRAYVMRFFNPRYANAPERDLLKWKHEYHNEWKPKDTHEKAKDWIDFFSSTLDLKDTELLPSLKEFNGQVRSRKRDLIWQGKPNTDNHGRYYADKSFDSDNLDEVTEAVKAVIAGKMSRSIGVYEDLLDSQELSEDEKQRIRVRLTKRLFNAHELFNRFVDSYELTASTYSAEGLQELNANKDRIPVYQDGLVKDKLALVRRSLDMEEAAAEMMESYLAGQEIDIDQIFKPGFKRSDEKYERLINLLLSETHKTTNGASPFDDEVRGFFRSHFFSNMVMINYEGRTLEFDEIPRRLASVFTRILVWAKERNISDERITKIEEYFSVLRTGKKAHREYQTIVDSSSISD